MPFVHLTHRNHVNLNREKTRRTAVQSWRAAAILLLPMAALAQVKDFTISGLTYAGAACAAEGKFCQLAEPARVAFGANSRFATKTFPAGRVDCTLAAFGTDPNPGVVKACYPAKTAVLVTPPPVSASAPAPAPPPASVPKPGTTASAPSAANTLLPAAMQAARLLNQATFGATQSEITAMGAKTPAAWVDEQLAKPLTLPSHWTYVNTSGPAGSSPNMNTAMESIWSQAITAPDQLRQRMALALSEIFVVSTINSPLENEPEAIASHLDVLSRNAFGNYRQLLEDVARSPAMGKYLSHMGNEKEEPISGRIPDENFAREVMQLFSIGLWELNPDGSRRLDASGNPIPTYTQNDVMGMARVFTGWSWGNGDYTYGFITGTAALRPYQRAWNLPMQNYAQFTSTGEKRLPGGVVIPAGTGGPQSLKIGLDMLANHPNVGPFIGRQLIQRFVTSNPSPAFVARVSARWANNGAGVRGDLGAVIKAVLTDPEARDDASINTPTFGKLREPMVRFGHWARAFNARATNNVWTVWNLESTVDGLGQNPMRAPSVFNFYRPTYAPPGAVQAAGLVAPEFQITHETTLTGYTNFMSAVVNSGYTGITPNYGSYEALADRPQVLLDGLSLVLMSGQLTPATRVAIRSAIDAIPMTQADARRARTTAAIYLLMASPEYTVQR
jgi:uncharacterized protein (DUF1800 family)